MSDDSAWANESLRKALQNIQDAATKPLHAEIERLRAELGETNDALAACQSEGQGWKRVAEELATLVIRLVRSHRTVSHNNDLTDKALDYLKRHGLVGSILRAADSASVVQYKPCEICTTQSWCETHGCQCYPVSAVQPERCCLDYPRCDCNSPPEPDNAPALQPCGHPWKAQHDSKCILCSSPGVTP